MKTKRTYLDGCKWCGATGVVSNNSLPPMSTMSNSTITCPVCNGSKVITVTEEFDDTEIIGIPSNPIIDTSKIEQDNIPILVGSWKECRKRTGLSLRQVAEMTGLSAATISRIENNQGHYMYDTYRRLNYFYHSYGEKKSK